MPYVGRATRTLLLGVWRRTELLLGTAKNHKITEIESSKQQYTCILVRTENFTAVDGKIEEGGEATSILCTRTVL